jgi:hypothetical protein
MLFDDEEQLEVRHVISLAHHDVSIYSGGDNTPEGELFIKRNALCLSRKSASETITPDGQLSKPFYLFSEDCSAKEDFYFALLQSQEQTMAADAKLPTPKQFDVKHIISLVQKLHSSEEHLQTRWLNALLGRVFLGVYRTSDLEHYIRKLIMKKISRVKRPSFLTNISVQGMDVGESAPFFTNIKLKDLTVEGETVVEADVKYSGNFRIEVATVAKIDLGGRFKVREVNLVLAVVLKRLEGHVFFKIKPPPSNRIWFSFQTMPKMEMVIEPVVSSRQITYTLILRHIENRIKEVFAETLVQPFWDDVPFFKTEHKVWRGGVFEDDTLEDVNNVEGAVAESGDVESMDRVEENHEILMDNPPMEKSQSLPTMDSQSTTTGLFGRKVSTKSPAGSTSASSTSLDMKGPASPSSRLSKMMQNPEPTVGTDSSHANVFKPSTSPPDYATNYMAALHSRSHEPSPATTPLGSPAKVENIAQASQYSSSSSREALDIERPTEDDSSTTPVASKRRGTTSSTESASQDPGQTASPPNSTAPSIKSQTGSIGRNFFLRREGTNNSISTNSTTDGTARKNTLNAVTNAANQARQWGWNAIQRQREAKKATDGPSQIDLTQPMGRGQPLPPPGTPLPRPTNGMTKIAPMQVPKRKPLAPSLPDRPAEDSGLDKDNASHVDTAPTLPNRRRRGATQSQEDEQDNMNMLVVAAPTDSQPASPAAEGNMMFPRMIEEDNTEQSDKSTTALALPAGASSTLHANAETDSSSIDGPFSSDVPIMAVPAPADAEDDDDYSGWMDNDEMEPDQVVEQASDRVSEQVK